MARQTDEYEYITRFRLEAIEAAERASEALKGLAEDTKGLGDASDELGDGGMPGLQAAARNFVAFAAAATTSINIVRRALGSFADFEVSMISVAKVTDLTEQEMADLGAAFQQAAADSGIAVQSFQDVAAVAGQLGIRGVANIRDFSVAMVEMGGATDLAADEAGTAIARMLSVTGENIDYARTLASIMVEMGNNVAATESEIASRAQEIVLATAAFGTTTLEATAMGATMAALGLRAETSGTAIGRIFISMTEAAVEGGETLAAFANAVELTEAQFVSLQEEDPTALFYRLLEVMSSKDQNTIVKTMSDLNLLNAETAKTLIPLITGYDQLAENRRRAYAEEANPDALTNEAARAAEALSRQYAGLMERITANFVQLGATFAPVAHAVIDMATTVLEAFDSLPDGVESFVMVLATVAPALLAIRLAASGVMMALRGLGFARIARDMLGLGAGARVAAGGLEGVGRGASVAARGLGAVRGAMGLLGGPLGVAIAALTLLPNVLSASSVDMGEVEAAGMQAAEALDAFEEASKGVGREQRTMSAEVRAASQEILSQSRIAMQEAKRGLEAQLEELQDGVSVSDIRANVEMVLINSETGQALGQGESLSNNPAFMALRESLAGFEAGTVPLEILIGHLSELAGIGGEAAAVVENFNLALTPTAERDLIAYAESVGSFREELEAIQNAPDRNAQLNAMYDLAKAIDDARVAAEALGGETGAAFVANAQAYADTARRAEALELALQGNIEAARELMAAGRDAGDGLAMSAEDATVPVEELAEAVEAARDFAVSLADAFPMLKAAAESLQGVDPTEALRVGVLSLQDLIISATDKWVGFMDVLRTSDFSSIQTALSRFGDSMGGLITGVMDRVRGDISNPVNYASQFLGMAENVDNAALQELLSVDPAITAWCANFVNEVLTKTGRVGSGSNMAQSFLNWGENADADPRIGDLAVFERGAQGGGSGHVGFVVGINPDGTLEILGGNQGARGEVSVKTFDRDRLLGIRRGDDAIGVEAAQIAENARAAESAASVREVVEAQEFQIAQQERINAGKEREAAIEEAIRDAKENNPDLGGSELEAIRERTGRLFDLEQQYDDNQEAADKAREALEDEMQAAKDAAEARKELLQSGEESIEQRERELELIGATVQEQARLQEMWRLMDQARRAGINIDNERTASGRTYREEIEATAEAVGKWASEEARLQKAQERAAAEKQFYIEQQNAMKEGILDAILEGENLIDTLSGVAKALARAAMQAALFGDGPMGNGGGFLGGDGGGILQSMFGWLGKAMGGPSGAPTLEAKGGIWGDDDIIEGSVMRDTASGPAIIGEAGPEAVMPLTRLRDGSLGVRVDGGSAPGAGAVTLNYNPSYNVNMSTGRVDRQGGEEEGNAMLKALDDTMRARMMEFLNDQMRPGGALNPATKAYG